MFFGEAPNTHTREMKHKSKRQRQPAIVRGFACIPEMFIYLELGWSNERVCGRTELHFGGYSGLRAHAGTKCESENKNELFVI